MKLEITTDQAEELIKTDIKYIVSTLENALDSIKNPSEDQLNMEGCRAKIYINDRLLKTLDELEKMQLEYRVNAMRIERHELERKLR